MAANYIFVLYASKKHDRLRNFPCNSLHQLLAGTNWMQSWVTGGFWLVWMLHSVLSSITKYPGYANIYITKSVKSANLQKFTCCMEPRLQELASVVLEADISRRHGGPLEPLGTRVLWYFRGPSIYPHDCSLAVNSKHAPSFYFYFFTVII